MRICNSSIFATNRRPRGEIPRSGSSAEEPERDQGVIGLNFYEDFVGGGRDFDALRAHLDRILGLGGAAHVALGGDWDGCDTIPFFSSDAVSRWGSI